MLQILGITIDFSFWFWLFSQSVLIQAAAFFALGAWVFLANFMIKAGVEMWVSYRQGKYTSKWEQVLLAVDVPPMFIQTPKAVEQIFAHLTGSLGHSNVADKFWHGKKQKTFSLEVISIEGYIQFLVRTEAEFRDLVEASIYAQYPEAEITEVEDYVSNIPDSYPNSEYDVMGVEFKLAQDQSYPIRVYSEFEYSLSKDAVFSDPMAAILENFTRISHGENLWMQLVVEPAGSSWKEAGIEMAKSVLKGGGGGHGHGGGGVLGGFSSLLGALIGEMRNVITWNFEPHEHEEEKSEATPGDRKVAELIEDKIAKVGFKSKLRVLYAARKEVYNPSRCVDGFVGAMNQFHVQNSNALVPAAATHAHYDRTHAKSNIMKTGFVKAYKGRKMKWGKNDGYILNIEELATLWHFPLPFVKTPLLHKAGHKRSEPPSGLPIEAMESPLKPKLPGGSEPLPPEKEGPPEELPYA